MTEAALNDAEFRALAVEMISGPTGFGTPSTLVIVETVHQPGTDRREKTRTEISLEATPPLPLSRAHVQLERVESTDAVIYVAAADCIDPRDGKTEVTPKAGWEFRQKGQTFAVIESLDWQSGHLSAMHELIVRGQGG